MRKEYLNNLVASGDEVAFFTAVLSCAAESLRTRGEGMLNHAMRTPFARSGEIQAAKQAMKDAGQALIATADAMIDALRMSDDSDVAAFDEAKMDTAVRAFNEYRAASERGTRILDGISQNQNSRQTIQ